MLVDKLALPSCYFLSVFFCSDMQYSSYWSVFLRSSM